MYFSVNQQIIILARTLIMAGQFLITLKIILAVVIGFSSYTTQNENQSSSSSTTRIYEQSTAASSEPILKGNQGSNNKSSESSNGDTHSLEGPSCLLRSDVISVKVLVGEANVLRVKEITLDPRVKLPLMILRNDISLYSVDYHYRKGLMFYVALDSLIVRVNVSGTHVTSEPKVLVNGTLGYTHLALDWLEDKLYWISNESKGLLEVANLDGSDRKTLLKNISYTFPNNIAVDPFEKWLFFVSNDAVFRYNLNTTNNKGEQVVLQANYSSAECIALDRHSKTLYTSAVYNSIPCIIRSEYDGSTCEILRIGQNYDSIFSIDIFRNWLIFVDYSINNDKDTVYSVKLPSKKNNRNIENNIQPEKWHESTNETSILSLKFYHPSVQSSMDSMPCLDTGTGSHINSHN